MTVVSSYKEAETKDLTRVSLEILPPLRGNGIQTIFNHLDPLMEFNPCFINVTYHRQEASRMHKKVNGFEETIVYSRRPGTIGICAAIQQHYGIDAVMHLICGGFTVEETEDALIELSYLNVKNVLALRGDGLKRDNRKFVPTPGGHYHTTELLQQIKLLKEGTYIDNLMSGAHMDFCIGVAGYPEKHCESASLAEDIRYLKEKIRLGGEYIITQMFFDNKHFFRFVRQCRKAGIRVPIIPGLKPITRKKHLTLLPEFFHIDIPDVLYKEIFQCADDTACAEIGARWLKQQSKELKEQGVPIIHYYTLGSALPIKRVLSEVF